MPSLTWTGKEKVINHHLDVPFHTIKVEYTYGKGDKEGEENSGNLIIHGDNLLALKALLPQYEGKVKLIYIDPPYNTGNENWVYNDNVNDPKIRKWLGQVVGKEGEDLTRHDKWLCMMYPRLKLLHKLLREDGAIFISIDDNEQANLRIVCNEIFSPSNFLANIVWKKKTNGNNMGHIPPVHDFIVVYAKNQNLLKLPGIKLSTEYLSEKYANPDSHPNGLWTTTDLSANHKGPYFEITNPITDEKYLPPKGRYWVFNEDEVKKRIADGRIIFGKSGNTKPVQRVFLNDRNIMQKPETWFDNQGYNSDGMTTLFDIFGTKVLEHPKPPSLIQYIINFSTEIDSIILDSFAGSGTTAHACLRLNQEDGGTRRFILVEMEDYAETITAERVKRVVDGYGSGEKKVPGTGGGFSYCTIGPAIFTSEGRLNPLVTESAFKQYIWYAETKSPMPRKKKIQKDENPYFLGSIFGVSYYFYFSKKQNTVLDYAFLKTIKTKDEQYVVYADSCAIEESWLQKHNVRFKKIPRDIPRY
jgi:adenine-specific DNA-methyltransferase